MNHDFENYKDWYKQKKTELHLGLYDGFVKSGILLILFIALAIAGLLSL